MTVHRIRTTIRPGVEIEVSDAELTDLKAQGLVKSESRDTKHAKPDNTEPATDPS